MKATDGMTADYAAHDEYQQSVAKAADDLVRDAAARGASGAGTFVLTDYGCSTNPHADMIRAAVQAVRRSDARREIAIVHADLPSNDWNALVAAAVDPQSGYIAGFDPQPLTAIAPRSFFEPVVASATVRLGVSFSAAHWLREQPQLDAGSWCFCDTREPAHAQLARAAATDWEAFWSARAREFAPGAIAIVQTIGRTVDHGASCVTAHDLLGFMREVAAEFVEEGRLDRERFEKFVFPTYARNAEEARAPFERGASLSECFEVERAVVFPVDNPYLPTLQTSGTDAYARSYVGFVRAFTASTLRDRLFNGDGALLDAYYARAIAAIAADPARGVFRDWTLQVVARRR